MLHTSEYVSIGHPDKVADYVSCYLLDRYLEKDPYTRAGIEVQLKDNFCSVAGEVTSEASFADESIARFVREAVNKIGYTKEYQKKWGKENTMCGDDLEVVVHLGQQSKDIAQGVDNGGWGDQGIFFGMAARSPSTQNLGPDYFLARKVANALYDMRIGGLDIKSMVTCVGTGVPVKCVVAIPLLNDNDKNVVEREVRKIIGDECRIIINGTGRYVKHGPIGDSGTTGRKLVVDFYGSGCRIGGGSPWGKDSTKADVSLNIYARNAALDYLAKNPSIQNVYTELSCCIGKPDVLLSFYDEHYRCLSETEKHLPTNDVISELGLRKPEYAERCMRGLFGFENCIIK